MTNHPQPSAANGLTVHNTVRRHPAWGRPNRPFTRRDGSFSTIHTPYYCYYWIS
jgi:hypothetical protein